MFTIRYRPPEAKNCVIVHNGYPMSYDPDNRRLYLSDGYTVFPSKLEAKRARQRAIDTEKAEGRVEEWKQYYRVEEV